MSELLASEWIHRRGDAVYLGDDPPDGEWPAVSDLSGGFIHVQLRDLGVENHSYREGFLCNDPGRVVEKTAHLPYLEVPSPLMPPLEKISETLFALVKLIALIWFMGAVLLWS